MKQNSIHSYPKVWHLGHRNVAGMFGGTVYVQEKYDGSQFAWQLTEEGELLFRSRRQNLDPEDAPDLFRPAIRHLREKKDLMVRGHTYRGEALKGPKHNTKRYGRAPKGNVVLFDIEGEREFMEPCRTMDLTAARLEIEPARLLDMMEGENPSPEKLDELLTYESSLGDTKVEGVVFKNYDYMSAMGDPSFAKFVSEDFKEEHKKNLDWKQGKDLFDALGSQFANDARWRKSVQRLRDGGQLEGSPKDIGPILRELSTDLFAEYGDALKERVWSHAWKRISKAANRGFPEWYKRELAFAEESSTRKPRMLVRSADAESDYKRELGLGEAPEEGEH